jgi:hypothetical protein
MDGVRQGNAWNNCRDGVNSQYMVESAVLHHCRAAGAFFIHFGARDSACFRISHLRNMDLTHSPNWHASC